MPLVAITSKTELVVRVVVPLLNITPVSGRSGKLALNRKEVYYIFRASCPLVPLTGKT